MVSQYILLIDSVTSIKIRCVVKNPDDGALHVGFGLGSLLVEGQVN